ncbi:VOC family protein [Phenylobacterium sp.]|uniref:VOC family protein n=1 Tax=Phenylobacterium sp. TaxID=1871053 RepID=UPI003983A1B5
MLDSLHARFHHLGVACRDLDRERAGWLALGYQEEGAVFLDPRQKIRGQFLTGPGPRIELVTPHGDGSPVDGYLARGTKIYHQAYECPDLEAALAILSAAGAKITAAPAPAVAFEGRDIAFVMLPNLNLIELIEAPE